MPNDKAFEDGQQLLKLKQTETTLVYISDFRALASERITASHTQDGPR